MVENRGPRNPGRRRHGAPIMNREVAKAHGAVQAAQLDPVHAPVRKVQRGLDAEFVEVSAHDVAHHPFAARFQRHRPVAAELRNLQSGHHHLGPDAQVAAETRPRRGQGHAGQDLRPRPLGGAPLHRQRLDIDLPLGPDRPAAQRDPAQLERFGEGVGRLEAAIDPRDLEIHRLDPAIDAECRPQNAVEGHGQAGQHPEPRQQRDQGLRLQADELPAQADLLAAPRKQEIATQPGPGFSEREHQIDLAGQPGRIAAQFDIRDRRPPDQAEASIVDGDLAAPDAYRGQEAERPADVGLRHELLDDRGQDLGELGPGLRRLVAGQLAQDGEAPVGIAREADARADDLDNGRRDDTLDQRAQAEPDHNVGKRRHHDPVPIADAQITGMKLDGAPLAGPDQLGTADLDEETTVQLVQRRLDVGREEVEPDRLLRQAPQRDRGQQDHHRQDPGDDLERDAGAFGDHEGGPLRAGATTPVAAFMAAPGATLLVAPVAPLTPGPGLRSVPRDRTARDDGMVLSEITGMPAQGGRYRARGQGDG